jgi:hypothetical protein
LAAATAPKRLGDDGDSIKRCPSCWEALTAGDRTVGTCEHCGEKLPAEGWQQGPMTIEQKYAAIRALLKNERDEWIEDVSGADFVQEVSLIIDAPTVPAKEAK